MMMIITIIRIKMLFLILAKKPVKSTFNFFCVSITGVYVFKKKMFFRHSKEGLCTPRHY